MSWQDPFIGKKLSDIQAQGVAVEAFSGQNIEDIRRRGIAVDERRGSRGATGSWEKTAEQLSQPWKGLVQIGQGAVNAARMPLDMAKTAYSAFTADPSALAPEEVPSYVMAGPGGLALHRLFAEPQIEQARKAAVPTEGGPLPSLSMPTAMGNLPVPIPQGIEKVGHGLASMLPFLGPLAAHFGETVGAGRPLEALGEAMTLGMLPKVARETKAYTQQRPVRLGRTTLDPVTGAPIPRGESIKVPLGEGAPDNPPRGVRIDFDPSVKLASEALGGDKALDTGLALKDRLSLVAPELAEARREAPSVRSDKWFKRQFDDWDDVRLQHDYARRKLWGNNIAPGLQGKMRAHPILDDFMANLPKDIELFDRQVFEPVYQKFKEIFDANPEIDVQKMQGLAARIREQIDLNANTFERFGDLSVVKTAVNKAFEDAIRKNIYDHIEAKTRVNIRPAMRKYGALSELQQDVLKMQPPEGFWERILSSYTFPTKRAVAARLGETTGKMQLGKIKFWNRAMRYPVEEAKLIRQVPEYPPEVADPLPRDPVTGELLFMGPSGESLLPGTRTRNYAFEIGRGRAPDPTPRHPVTGEILMPPVPVRQVGAGLLEYDGKFYGQRAPLTDKLDRHPITGELLMPTAPPEIVGNDLLYKGKTHYQVRLTDKQIARARALWEKAKPSQVPSIPEEPLIPGLTPGAGATPGVKMGAPGKGQMDLLRREPSRGGALAPPDLFAIQQTPYKWRPSMMAGSTLQALKMMKAEIERYLRTNPAPNIRKQWAADAAMLHREILRRQIALGDKPMPETWPPPYTPPK